jgi:FlaG protein
MPPHAASRPPTPPATPPDRPAAPAQVSAAIPDSPPPEVLEAMGAAAHAYDRLKTAGRRLHFETDNVTGRVIVQLLDPDGNVVTTLPPSKVLDLASGGTLD